MLYHAQEMSVPVHGSRMTCVRFGSGTRPLVLIPGLSLRSIHGSALPLAWSYRMFCRDWQVYVFDKKDCLPDPCTVSTLADDTAEAMHQLGIANADVIGISQGGMIAQYLALDHPGLVRRLVLGVTLSRSNDTIRAVIEKWIRDAEHGDYKAIVRDMTLKMYSPRYIRRYGWLFPILMRTMHLTDPGRFVKLAGACLTCDAYSRLKEIRCPVLVLGGKEDRIVGPDASREIAERLGCPAFLYDGLGHSAYEEGRDFNQRIRRFLNEA